LVCVDFATCIPGCKGRLRRRSLEPGVCGFPFRCLQLSPQLPSPFLNPASMRIVRYQSPSGDIRLAHQPESGPAVEVDGDLFQPKVSTRPAQIQKVLAPLQPTAIICIGLNYRQHAAETKAPLPKFPVVFMKSPGAVPSPRS